MPEFNSRDPTQATFWDERFAADFTPWDARGVPPMFERWIAAGNAPPGTRVLIPGCGSAYEVALVDARGGDVLAIDYSAAAVARARAVLAPALAERALREADFFTFDAQPFDCIYERAFLAALPPSLWPRWAQRTAQLLRPGGRLVGFFHLEAKVPEPRRGPPFAITAAELDQLLGEHFEREQDDPVPAAESLPVFSGRERWQVWQRR